MMKPVVLAIDIGGTETRAALVDRNGGLLDSVTTSTPVSDGPDAVVATIAKLASVLVERFGSRVAVHGIGVGVADSVYVATGLIVCSTNTVVDWAGTELPTRIRSALSTIIAPGAIMHVQNDVDAHAVGEFRYGAAAGAASTLVVAVGTGVGSGLVIDGKVVRGAHHVAGEISHIPTPGAEHLGCPCGRFGHLEAIGSGIGMHRHYLSLGGSATNVDVSQIAAAAHDGDDLARRAMRDSASAVGRAIAAAATLLDPERVVITGGVAHLGKIWWSPMEEMFRAEIIDVLHSVPVLLGQLGANAALLGAAASAWDDVKASNVIRVI